MKIILDKEKAASFNAHGSSIFLIVEVAVSPSRPMIC